MEVRTEVMVRVPEWNCLHQKTVNYLATMEGNSISAGLVKRLMKYAIDRMAVSGFAIDWAKGATNA